MIKLSEIERELARKPKKVSKLPLIFLVVLSFIGLFLIASAVHEGVHYYQDGFKSKQICAVGLKDFVDRPVWEWSGGWEVVPMPYQEPRYLLPTKNTEFEAGLFEFIVLFIGSYLIFKSAGMIEDENNKRDY